MQPSSDTTPNSRFWVVVERIGSLAGIGGLVVAGVLYFWSLPLLAVPTDTIWELEPHTAAKHEILKLYLQP